MNNKIQFVSFYDIKENTIEERHVALAAINKMNSVIDGLVKNGYKIEIISMSSTMGKKNCPCHLFCINESVNLKLFKSFGRKNKIFRVLEYFSIRLQLFIYLLKNIKQDEIVFVYHSLEYIKLIRLLKIIKKFKLVLEMEEIYGDVIGNIANKKEEFKLAKAADGFIFPTQLLNQLVNTNNKPAVVIHGSYYIHKLYKNIFDDNKIHVVYAGTLDPRKGCICAVAAASYLNENYHVHIIGFGSDIEKQQLTDFIKKTSIKTKCTITYDGLKSGEEYIKFVQSCQIGLSTQNPNARFSDTSFPSKVLSYLGNGLRVVSIRIKSLEISSVNDLLFYYDEDKPKAIAEAIMKVNLFEKYDSRACLSMLFNDFVESIKNLICKLND